MGQRFEDEDQEASREGSRGGTQAETESAEEQQAHEAQLMADHEAHATELSESLEAMRQDLRAMEQRREDLKEQIAKAELEEQSAQDKTGADGEEDPGLDECAKELVEILSEGGLAGPPLDDEDLQGLLPLSVALLGSEKTRSELPLPLIFRKMQKVLLPKAKGGSPGEGEEPSAFVLSTEELTALLCCSDDEVPLWLADSLLESAQGRVLDADDAVVAMAQRPELLQPVLRCGRFRLQGDPEDEEVEELEEEHLLALGLCSEKARDAVLKEPKTRAVLSEAGVQRLLQGHPAERGVESAEQQ